MFLVYGIAADDLNQGVKVRELHRSSTMPLPELFKGHLGECAAVYLKTPANHISAGSPGSWGMLDRVWLPHMQAKKARWTHVREINIPEQIVLMHTINQD